MTRRSKDYLIQLGAIGVVAALLLFFGLNAHANLARLGITSGFEFLFRSTGWDVSFSLVDYSIDDPYWRVIVIGVQNTIFVGTLSIIFATLIGTALGVARTSINLVLGAVAGTYVEIFRSIPMTLQIIFWYAVMTNLPGPRSAYSFWDVAFLSNRGLILPSFRLFGPWMFIAGAVAGSAWLLVRSRRRLHGGSGGERTAVGLLAFVFVVALAAILGGNSREPLVEVPRLRGLGFQGGLQLVPEFTALLVAVVIAGSAYVAEAVRGALLAVPRGQIEAALALGLKPAAVYLKIKFPIALRLVLPPLGNQYMMIMKATTIGIVIGFSDLFMVVAVSINQSGQTIELIMIMMAAFVAINYTISTLINVLNRKVALKGYAWKVEA